MGVNENFGVKRHQGITPPPPFTDKSRTGDLELINIRKQCREVLCEDAARWIRSYLVSPASSGASLGCVRCYSAAEAQTEMDQFNRSFNLTLRSFDHRTGLFCEYEEKCRHKKLAECRHLVVLGNVCLSRKIEHRFNVRMSDFCYLSANDLIAQAISV